MSCVWLTIDEAAHHLNVHKDTIRKWIRKGKLRTYRPGGTIIRICKDDLESIDRDA